MGSDSEDKRKELLEVLAQVPADSASVGGLAGKIQETAHFVAGFASAELEFFKRVPAESLSPEEWQRQADTWRFVGSWAKTSVGNLTVLSSGFDAAAYAASGSNTSIVIALSARDLSRSPDRAISVRKMDELIQRTPLLDAVREDLLRLRLDTRGGADRPALELLNEAARLQGIGSSSALVTLRESMRAAIAELNRRKPRQEAGAALLSVGRQCGQPGLHEEHFGRLGIDVDALLNELSGSKGRVVFDSSNLFHRALLQFQAVLSSIDEKKLRV